MVLAIVLHSRFSYYVCCLTYNVYPHILCTIILFSSYNVHQSILSACPKFKIPSAKHAALSLCKAGQRKELVESRLLLSYAVFLNSMIHGAFAIDFFMFSIQRLKHVIVWLLWNYLPFLVLLIS